MVQGSIQRVSCGYSEPVGWADNFANFMCRLSINLRKPQTREAPRTCLNVYSFAFYLMEHRVSTVPHFVSSTVVFKRIF